MKKVARASAGFSGPAAKEPDFFIVGRLPRRVQRHRPGCGKRFVDELVDFGIHCSCSEKARAIARGRTASKPSKEMRSAPSALSPPCRGQCGPAACQGKEHYPVRWPRERGRGNPAPAHREPGASPWRDGPPREEVFVRPFPGFPQGSCALCIPGSAWNRILLPAGPMDPPFPRRGCFSGRIRLFPPRSSRRK